MLTNRCLVLIALLGLAGCPMKNSDPGTGRWCRRRRRGRRRGAPAAEGGAAGQTAAVGAAGETPKLSPDAAVGNPGKPLAEACAANSECASGFCVDSVCCNTACDGQCSICNPPGNLGYCTGQITGDDTTSAQTCTGAHTCSIAIAVLNLPACRLKDLQACKANADCASLNCVTYLRRPRRRRLRRDGEDDPVLRRAGRRAARWVRLAGWRLLRQRRERVPRRDQVLHLRGRVRLLGLQLRRHDPGLRADSSPTRRSLPASAGRTCTAPAAATRAPKPSPATKPPSTQQTRKDPFPCSPSNRFRSSPSRCPWSSSRVVLTTPPAIIPIRQADAGGSTPDAMAPPADVNVTVPRNPLGTACSSNTDCTSGFCTDGVCCDSACGQTCYSCALQAALGHCAALTTGQDPNATTTCTAPSACFLPASSSVPACKFVDGTACQSPGDCVSGHCLTYYVDADGDGFGSNEAASFCEELNSPPPAGYAAYTGDCCDLDAGANPGFDSTQFLTMPDACGSFDWNCNGVVAQQKTCCHRRRRVRPGLHATFTLFGTDSPSSPKPAIEPLRSHRSNCCHPGALVAPGWFRRLARRIAEFRMRNYGYFTSRRRRTSQRAIRRCRWDNVR